MEKILKNDIRAYKRSQHWTMNLHALFLRRLLFWTRNAEEYLEALNGWNQLVFQFELAKLLLLTKKLDQKGKREHRSDFQMNLKVNDWKQRAVADFSRPDDVHRCFSGHSAGK